MQNNSRRAGVVAKQEAEERMNKIMGNTPFGKVHESGSWLGITGGTIGRILQKSQSESRRCISRDTWELCHRISGRVAGSYKQNKKYSFHKMKTNDLISLPTEVKRDALKIRGTAASSHSKGRPHWLTSTQPLLLHILPRPLAYDRDTPQSAPSRDQKA